MAKPKRKSVTMYLNDDVRNVVYLKSIPTPRHLSVEAIRIYRDAGVTEDLIEIFNGGPLREAHDERRTGSNL